MSATDLSFAESRTIDPTMKGVAAMVACMVCQALNDTVVKLAAARLPTHEIMALRGVFAVAMTLLLIVAMGQRRCIPAVAQPLVALRSGLEAIACLIYMSALAGLGLAEFTSIVQATPLIITMLAVLLGWQSVGWRRWAAIGAGFVGVLLVAQPSAAGVNAYSALALAAAFVMAVRDLVTRKLSASAPSLVVTLGATISVTVVGFALGAVHPDAWVAPDAREIALLISASLLVVLCNLLIVMAFRGGDMTVVGPFRYSVILFSLALGVLVWGDRPAPIALAGSALIVASGLVTLRRGRTAATAAAAAPV